jgi:hypothetical protein
MKIKKEWYEEDQKAKAAALAEQEKAMTKEASSDYGSVKITRDK